MPQGHDRPAPKSVQPYWDALWAAPFDPSYKLPGDPAFLGYVGRSLAATVSTALQAHAVGASKLIELGCARSRWLPYFAREHGLRVTGIDYSSAGCSQARAALEAAGVEGDILCADMFSPEDRLRDAFDVVVSFGLIEHFGDTVAALRAIGGYLKRGGVVITLIPNMKGVPGLLQRMLSRTLYDLHVPLDKNQLCEAHCAAGFTLLGGGYLLPFNGGVVGFPASEKTVFKRLLQKALSATTIAVFALDRARLAPRPNRLTSPYVFAIARK